jgi:hypothetical protein
VENIAKAKEDVKHHAAGGLPNILYGEVPYIVAHAAAGSKVQASGEVLNPCCPP